MGKNAIPKKRLFIELTIPDYQKLQSIRNSGKWKSAVDFIASKIREEAL